MIHKILVALDASPRAEGVFQSAVALAEPLGASMHLFRAVAIPPEFPPAGHVSQVDGLPAYLIQQAQTQLRAFVERAPRLQVESSVVESSQPWRAILEAAERVGADLIIIGSHGYHGIDHLLGTTAGRVANLAPRNVLVIHQSPHPRPAGGYRRAPKPAGA